MASTFAWLDFSADEQRRARELVQLFSQPDTLDELGVGVVRDAFADLLFPGFSTVQTRARYFLFVPWIFEDGVGKKRRGRELLDWVASRERQLIGLIKQGGDEDGLIGRLAGKDVKILPSTIYWSGLGRLGVLSWSCSKDELAARVGRAPTIEEALTERVERSDRPWHRNLPSPPKGFGTDPVDFALTRREAEWMSETFVAAAPESLLAWMLEHRLTPHDASVGPWEEAWRNELPSSLLTLLYHAERFSVLMRGAALVYNLMLEQRAESLHLSPPGLTNSTHRDGLLAWAAEAAEFDWSTWALGEMWRLTGVDAAPRTALTRQFVEGWLSTVCAVGADHLADSEAAFSLVGLRERALKGTQARLVNDRMMGQWSGASGLAPLQYRWSTARRMLRDIEQGRASAGT